MCEPQEAVCKELLGDVENISQRVLEVLRPRIACRECTLCVRSMFAEQDAAVRDWYGGGMSQGMQVKFVQGCPCPWREREREREGGEGRRDGKPSISRAREYLKQAKGHSLTMGAFRVCTRQPWISMPSPSGSSRAPAFSSSANRVKSVYKGLEVCMIHMEG